MKMMTALSKPFELDNVREALQQVGIAGMTVAEGIRTRTGETGEDAQ